MCTHCNTLPSRMNRNHPRPPDGLNDRGSLPVARRALAGLLRERVGEQTPGSETGETQEAKSESRRCAHPNSIPAFTHVRMIRQISLTWPPGDRHSCHGMCAARRRLLDLADALGLGHLLTGQDDGEVPRSLQQKNIPDTGRLPTAAHAVSARVGPVVVGDCPVPGDLSPHRLAVGI